MINDDRLPLKEKFLEYYRELPNQGLASDSIGKDEDTIIRWKNEDTEFADLVKDAKAQWALRKSKRIKDEAWLMERVLNDHFGNKTKTDITSNGKELTPVLVKFLNDESNRDTK